MDMSVCVYIYIYENDYINSPGESTLKFAQKKKKKKKTLIKTLKDRKNKNYQLALLPIVDIRCFIACFDINIMSILFFHFCLVCVITYLGLK